MTCPHYTHTHTHTHTPHQTTESGEEGERERGREGERGRGGDGERGREEEAVPDLVFLSK
jgi:hypothetical protein